MRQVTPIDQSVLWQKEQKLIETIISTMTSEGVSLVDATVYAQQHSKSFMQNGTWSEDSLQDLQNIANKLPKDNLLIKKMAVCVGDPLNFAERAKMSMDEEVRNSDEPWIERSIGDLDYFQQKCPNDVPLSHEDKELMLLFGQVGVDWPRKQGIGDETTVQSILYKIHHQISLQKLSDEKRQKSHEILSKGPARGRFWRK